MTDNDLVKALMPLVSIADAFDANELDDEARNPSVAEYMHHWEARAEKAEALVAELKANLEQLLKQYQQEEHEHVQMVNKMTTLVKQAYEEGARLGCTDYSVWDWQNSDACTFLKEIVGDIE